ncbi:MAG: tripartite tricarboxylate transporter TctB family protein, partial [Desulfovibrio fairfieldensis]|nr:tripartite tricarboxylate transporter TctB family protein [Desulfovibrio fairfieldensis]
MQANTNTDMVGGLAVLAVSAFFYSQISEDFTQFGVFFPKLILPCLVLLGVILLVRGLARRTKKKTIFRINRTMALVMIVGALWAVIMNYLGFIVGSSLAL